MTSADASQQPGANAPAPSQASFATYADYVDHIGSKTDPAYKGYGNNLVHHLRQVPNDSWEYNLTLIRFYKDGKPSLLRRLNAPDFNAPDSFFTFRDIFNAFDDTVEYQVVMIACGSNRLPPARIVDMIGLGLDMDPEVWRYFCSLDVKQTVDRQDAVVWMKRDDIIEVDADALMILDAVENVRPLTGLVFLGPQPPPRGLVWIHVYPYPKLYPPEAPSSLQKQDPLQATGFHGQPRKNTKSDALSRRILDAAVHSPKFGSKNVLFPCLEALLRWQMCTAPRSVAELVRMNGLEEITVGKYQRLMKVDREPGQMWQRLRDEVDPRRMTLLALPSFAMNNFDMQERSFARVYEQLQRSYEQYVRELEVEEARLRDRIEFYRSAKSTEMAELSIQESKRVMLLTVLAFVFVPASLACSIYGMNIQQINGTGHDIRSFVITAVVLLLTTLVLWAGGSILREYRLHRLAIVQKQAEERRFPSWYDRILEIRSWSQILGWARERV